MLVIEKPLSFAVRAIAIMHWEAHRTQIVEVASKCALAWLVWSKLMKQLGQGVPIALALGEDSQQAPLPKKFSLRHE
jgi:hypothetical protein